MSRRWVTSSYDDGKLDGLRRNGLYFEFKFIKEDASHSVCLTYMDVNKISKFEAESVFYAGVTLALQTGGCWRARDGFQQYVSLNYNSHREVFRPKFGDFFTST